MDDGILAWTDLLSLVLNFVFGGGLLALYGAHRKARVELATARAAQTTADAATVTAENAGWNALMEYWQTEIRDLRTAQLKDHGTIAGLQASRDIDRKYIDMLQQHIWEQKPPPPPAPPSLREEQPFTD
ncbi:hypothetical protein [Sinomonas sp. ASV322]|uniref:hypothetical protein n=1 Tax=Sinomonas sp. ASV322 TaxID=3041920 RepID=UPI0027DB0A1B|nr:hypothetical protein [Sinomonas sp. ASV322]MDQ4502190.1 hypothetical protein [Sinomonas sp. ASV322]